jgi:steroid delta-isomerase-like uncharacterized protein
MSTSNTAKSLIDANKALVRSYYEAVNKGPANAIEQFTGQFPALDQFFAPDYKRYLTATGAPLNADGQKQRLIGLRSAFPDLQLTIDNIIAEGDYVAICLTVTGTQQGKLQGIPATGKLITVSAFEVMHIVNGKIIEHWGGPDNLVLMQQRGMVLSPGK